MTIRRGYKLRLYPTGAQRHTLEHWCDGARWTWNTCLDWRETLYRCGHAKNVSGQHWFSEVVTRWKAASDHPWLNGAGTPHSESELWRVEKRLSEEQRMADNDRRQKHA